MAVDPDRRTPEPEAGGAGLDTAEFERANAAELLKRFREPGGMWAPSFDDVEQVTVLIALERMASPVAAGLPTVEEIAEAVWEVDRVKTSPSWSDILSRPDSKWRTQNIEWARNKAAAIRARLAARGTAPEASAHHSDVTAEAVAEIQARAGEVRPGEWEEAGHTATAAGPVLRDDVLDAVGEVIASKMKHDTLDHYRRERDLFRQGSVDRDAPGYTGHYEGCQAEAESFVERLRTRGFDVAALASAAGGGGADGWSFDMDAAPRDGTVLTLFARWERATACVVVMGWWFPGNVQNQRAGWIASSFDGQPIRYLVCEAWQHRPAFPIRHSNTGIPS